MVEDNKPKNDVAPWMTTFADLTTLLLTFFVLLLSFATMDVEKFKDALGSIQQSFGFLPTGTGIFQHVMEPPIFPSLVETSLEAPVKIGKDEYINVKESVSKEMIREIEELVKNLKIEDEVMIENTKRGIILRVKSQVFFNLGEAELKEESYPILKKVAELMNKFSRNVSIEGHTDSLPITGGPYSSNWELSALRALSVLHFFKEKEGIEDNRINISGFADTRPIASNDTEEGRSKNRRVEFVFYK